MTNLNLWTRSGTLGFTLYGVGDVSAWVARFEKQVRLGKNITLRLQDQNGKPLRIFVRSKDVSAFSVFDSSAVNPSEKERTVVAIEKMVKAVEGAAQAAKDGDEWKGNQ